MSITDFMLARIAEDEGMARKVAVGVRTAPRLALSGNPAAGTVGAHPARVLAECEAKRRILTAASGWDDAEPDAKYCMDRIRRILAAVYAEHPDYREEWRP